MNKQFKFYLKILSPVHIAGGDEINPFNYTVKRSQVEDKNIYTIYYIDTFKFINLLSDDKRNKLLSILKDDNNINMLANSCKFIFEEFDSQQHQNAVKYSYIVNNMVYKIYTNMLQTNNFDNGIRTVIKDGKLRPYIPGSSIKGLLRKAFFFKYDIMYDIPIKKDPFSLLSIEDMYPVQQNGLGIGFVRDFHHNEFVIKDSKVNYNIEYMKSKLTFTYNISIKNNISNLICKDKFIEEFSDPKNIISLLNHQYRPMLNSDKKRFFSEKGNNFISNVADIEQKYGDNVAIVNIGRYAGEDFKAVVSNNEKKSLSRRLFTLNNNKTIYDASEVMPVGWVAVYAAE